MNFSNDSDIDVSTLEINLTPLIDIVFLLLIFFMVSTTFIDTPGIDVQLPKASARTIEIEKKDVTVIINAKGQLFLDSNEIELDSLATHLSKERLAHMEISLIIRADEEVSHGKVVRVMDLAKKSGIERIAIATRP
jgi:biopolymer transport protein ExbD